jgi:hypothetical protein
MKRRTHMRVSSDEEDALGVCEWTLAWEGCVATRDWSLIPTCVSYEEEDTCVSYEEEDTCVIGA